jgi:hypothetical protein
MVAGGTSFFTKQKRGYLGSYVMQQQGSRLPLELDLHTSGHPAADTQHAKGEVCSLAAVAAWRHLTVCNSRVPVGI